MGQVIEHFNKYLLLVRKFLTLVFSPDSDSKIEDKTVSLFVRKVRGIYIIVTDEQLKTTEI